MKSLKRTFLEADRCLTPALSSIGHVRCSEARKGIYAHRHPECFEIFYFIRGQVRWWVEDRTHNLVGNQVLIHRPGVMHGSERGILQPSEYFWLNLHEPTLRQRNDSQWNQLLDALAALTHTCFAGDKEMVSDYQCIFQELHSPDALSKLGVEVALRKIVLRVLRAHDHFVSSKAKISVSTPIKRSLDWSKSHLPEATVEGMRLAALMPLQPFRVTFRREVGLTPLAYIHYLKIEGAKQMLRNGRTVTDTAHALGFSSSQHLATLFRNIEGVTPTESKAGDPKTMPADGNSGIAKQQSKSRKTAA